jgi:hypothetical protein
MCLFLDNVKKKHGRVRQDTGDNTVRRVSFACWVNKATGTPQNIMLFHGNSGYVKVFLVKE